MDQNQLNFCSRMHQDRKEAKLMLWMEAAAAEEAENDDDDWEEDDLEGERQQLHPHHQRRVSKCKNYVMLST